MGEEKIGMDLSKTLYRSVVRTQKWLVGGGTIVGREVAWLD